MLAKVIPFRYKKRMNTYMIIILSFTIIWPLLFLGMILLEKLNKIPNFSALIAIVYRGYRNDSFSGIFTGFSWAVLDGLITGTVMAIIMYLLR